MLILNNLIGFGAGGSSGATFKEMIDSAGLATSLACCLDAGAIGSYDGSSQQWSDLSGNSNHFYRGATSGSEASDPTFNGVAGALSASEYFSHDGGDYFTETAAHTFAENWHKNNAVYSIVAVLFRNSSGTGVLDNIFGNNSGLSGTGTVFGIEATGSTPILRVRNAGANVLNTTSVLGLNTSEWAFVGLGYDEAAGAGDFKVNTLDDPFSSTYSSPSAGASSSAYNVSARGAGGSPTQSGSRIACVAFWDGRRLSATEMGTLYTEVKKRFTAFP